MKDTYTVTRNITVGDSMRRVVEGLRDEMVSLMDSEGANPLNFLFTLYDHSQEAEPRMEVTLTAVRRERSW